MEQTMFEADDRNYTSASPTILIPKKNLIFDATLLSTVMGCGRKADFRHNLNLVAKGGKSVNLEMGSIVHKFLEVYLKSKIAGLTNIQSSGQAEVATREYMQNPEEVRNCTDEDKLLALETCKQYLEYYANDYWIPLAVEEVRQEILYEDDEIRILWKVKYDWIADTNQGIHPVDHKSMKQRRDTLSLNNQFMGQCIVLRTNRIFINKIGFQKTLAPNEKFTRPPIYYSDARLMEWQSETLPYWAKIYLMYHESGHWPPNYTHCENKWGMCEYKDVCEADPILRPDVLANEFVAGKPWDPNNE